ncbi:MAG: S1C family serine protease [Oscillospiraceae bacterium]|nr:S1C family serine protease [Oscillospiraceae bacterium]
MYPGNNDEKREYPEQASVDGMDDAFVDSASVETHSYDESPVSGQQYDEQQYNKSVYNEPVYYNEHIYDQPVQIEPVYYSEQNYNEQTYNEPAYNKPVYNKSNDIPMNMYSPGICVNQPYPRARENGNGRNGSSRENTKGLVGFIRAMTLIFVCAVLSAAAAYIVIDHRIERGDFAPPNQVVLGNGFIDRRPDESTTSPVVSVGDGMTAQDIYDMARNQVVVINTDAPNFMGIPELSRDTSPISGTGFIVSSDGYILTNFHVIEIAHANNLPVNVILNDGQSFEAEIIGFERDNDVAVLKIDAEGLYPVFIGDSNNIRVGQTVYAVGNPFGDLVFTMTDGIVSALDRVVSVEGRSIRTFQFSAAVNSGNSGGPIYNSDGEVIGIVTAKVVRGNVEGIGFAIPINDAIEIATELIEHGYITGRALIGITGQPVSPANADYFDWVVGVYIRSVAPGSAADNAGLEVGDIITALGGNDVDSVELLRFILRDYRAGDTTTITIWRDGEILDLSISFDEDKRAGLPLPREVIEPDSPDPFEGRP